MASPKIQHWGPASYRYCDTKNHHIVAKRLKRKEKFGLEHSDAILQALFRLCKVKSMVEISWRTLYVGLRMYVRTAEYLNKEWRRWCSALKDAKHVKDDAHVSARFKEFRTITAMPYACVGWVPHFHMLGSVACGPHHSLSPSLLGSIPHPLLTIKTWLDFDTSHANARYILNLKKFVLSNTNF